MSLKKTSQNNQGFTLVELIVALVIGTMLVALTCGVLVSTGVLFQRHATLNEAKFVGDTIYNMLADTLVYTTEVKVSETTEKTAGFNAAFLAQDGRLKLYDPTSENKKPQEFYSEDFYLNTNIHLAAQVINQETAKEKDERWLWLQVSVYDWDDETLLYQTASTVELVNMRLAKQQNAEQGQGIINNIGEKISPKPVIYCNSEQLVHPATAPSQYTEFRTYFNLVRTDSSQRIDAIKQLPAGSEERIEAIHALQTDYGLPLSDTINEQIFRNNTQLREIIVAKYYNNKWPVFTDDLPVFGTLDKRAFDTTKPLFIQFHWDAATGSFITYAIQQLSQPWAPVFIYNINDGYWYSPYPIGEGTSRKMPAGAPDMGLTATPRYDDEYYANLVKYWIPIK